MVLNGLYFFYSWLNKLTFYILIQFNCIYWLWLEVAPSQSSEIYLFTWRAWVSQEHWVFSNPLDCCHLSSLRDPEESDLSPRLFKKIRACLENLPLCPEEWRSGHRGRMVLRVQRVMIPRFLHPFLLSTTAHHTPIAARIHLQVLCWPQEKSRLPFFVLTRNIRLIFSFETFKET